MKHFRKFFSFSFKKWLLFCIIFLSGCDMQQKNISTPPSPAPSSIPETTNSPTPKKTYRQAVAQTEIFDQIPERTNNLHLAIQAINGMLLKPKEVFSFNEAVGNRTEEKGYQKAIGYDEHGEKKPTVGGGICQIATTLYMAAKNGEFEIIERHSHSHEVPYADSDHDATVSYGGYDFQFRNNRDKPVKILISTDGKTVYAEITDETKSP